MSHYDTQREKFENQPKPYFVKRETGSPVSRTSLTKTDEEINRRYEELHPIVDQLLYSIRPALRGVSGKVS